MMEVSPCFGLFPPGNIFPESEHPKTVRFKFIIPYLHGKCKQLYGNFFKEFEKVGARIVKIGLAIANLLIFHVLFTVPFDKYDRKTYNEQDLMEIRNQKEAERYLLSAIVRA